MSAQPLDLLRIPMSGTHLVEASAGTGKTFSITWMYLRLLLEQNRTVEQILVVTFTDAAAEELRERLRRRLIWARSLFTNGHPSVDDADGARFWALVAQCKDIGIHRMALQETLQRTLENFDRAAIFTIHGWCRRILIEHALETDTPLARLEIANAEPHKRSIVEDIWRRELHRSEEHAAWLLRCFATPSHLFQAIQGLFTLPAQVFDPADPDAELTHLQRSQQEIISVFLAVCDEASRIAFVALFADKRFGISTDERKGYKPEQVRDLLDDIGTWIGGGRATLPAPPDIARFHPDFFFNSQTDSAIRQGKPLPDHPILNALLALATVQEKIARMQRAKLLLRTLRGAQIELQRSENATGILGYDALIGRVHDALMSGPGERLVVQLRSRYPVALVDEFQDTDQQQFAIFKALYADAGLLIMIGDAKQAIYRFRGGDVFAYGQARNFVQDKIHTLNDNFRSEPALVSAINLLFSKKNNFIYDFIAWKNINGVGPRGGAFLTPNPHPLVIWHAHAGTAVTSRDNPTIGVGKLTKAIGAAVADEIVRLLKAGAGYELSFGGGSLCASDIAVLVNTHEQAAVIERSLRRCGVNAARLSRESVYASAQARDLLTLLRAILHPRRNSYLHAALSTETVGWDAKRLVHLTHAVASQEQVQQRFRTFAAVWRDYGPVALIEELLREFAGALLTYKDGERRVANFRHLGEMLSEKYNAGCGMHEQLEVIEIGVHTPNAENEIERLRYASDAAAVQVVTIHASKGLEYPIVFAPFLWQAAHGVAEQAPVISHRPTDLGIVVDLGSAAFESRAKSSERENYAEAMRRAYVACTRAINRLYLVWGKIADAQYSPCARLLHGVPEDDALLQSHYLRMDDVALRAELQRLAEDSHGAITIRSMPAAADEQWQEETPAFSLSARQFTREFNDRRGIYSFTRIVATTLDGERIPQNFLTSPVTPNEISSAKPEDKIPRGAVLGECLHAILQQIDFQDARGRLANGVIAENVERYGFDHETAAVISLWIRKLLNSELLPGLRLAQIPKNCLVKEMEFHFALEQSSINNIHHLARRFNEYADAMGLLTQMPNGLQGWMHGYIDLVVEQAGRFFVIDYKSNYLGDSQAEYGKEQLAAALTSHRYDLQLLIYLIALHRYLKLRMGDRYRAEINLGGALCVFVRGVDENIPSSGVQKVQPPIELILALDQCFN